MESPMAKNGKMATAKPEKKAEKTPKLNKTLLDIKEALGYMLEEIDDVQIRLKKVEGRMGL